MRTAALVATILLAMVAASCVAAEETMKTMTIATGIGAGEDQEVVKVYETTWTRILQIHLRNGKTLSAHTAKEPVTIHCTSGEGVLVVGDQRIELKVGVIVALEPNVTHAVEAKPAVSLLVTRFLPAAH
jgi:quercetin dioxygenase-like cupin family protein